VLGMGSFYLTGNVLTSFIAPLFYAGAKPAYFVAGVGTNS
jgi:hypothetical protein